eukprot:jgi/Tetstr1/465853/TSEL_010472.t1
MCPLEADTPFIVRYVAWAACRGRKKQANALQPYMSVINTFFRDHLKEPVALGPLVNHATRCGASAASAAGIPLPKICWLGDWVHGSSVVHTYIVPGILDPTGGQFFFDDAAGLSAATVMARLESIDCFSAVTGLPPSVSLAK